MINNKKMTELRGVIKQVVRLAKQYRDLADKPLGITGEVGEFYAAELLSLRLTDPRCPGYDATGPDRRRIQIKARCILPGSKPGQRVGGIRFTHKWDTVVLILLNEDFEPIQIYEAKRNDAEKALKAPGSKARNERGSLSVSKFKSISKLVWPKKTFGKQRAGSSGKRKDKK